MNKKINVLMVSTTFIPSVILCGHCQLDYLEKNDELNYKFVIAHFISAKEVSWADIIIYLRSDSDIDAYVSKLAKKAHKHQIYVLDDDLLNAPGYVSSFPYYNLPSTKKNIRTIMSNCDTFLTTSPVLQKKYGTGFKNCFLISEPSLNRIDKKPKNKKIKIGFAGSIDRAQDLNQILEGAIKKIVKKYKTDVDIEFMGAKPAFVEELGLTHLPYQDGYDAYTAFMSKSNWDIGLAPMPDTEFHSCKYFNKYVEYASFGIAGIYSNLKPYVYGIKDKYNGLLVSNSTDSWYKAISELIEDSKLRNKISKNCLKEANEIYSLDICAKDYLSKILIGYDETTERKAIGSLDVVKTIIFFKRVYRKVVEQGLNFPKWLIDKLSKKINDYFQYRKDIRNKEFILELISKQKTTCVFAPYIDSKNEYDIRIKDVDESYLKDSYNIYLSGEDRLCEHLMIDLLDDRHAKIVFNSYDIKQAEEVIDLINKSGNCLIHGVTRFMREKLSNEMHKIFVLDNLNIIWDTHGMIPEEYHKKANYHTEAITAQLEEMIDSNSDVILCENKKLVEHFKKKYNNKKAKYVII